jgi:tetratricopeptide (TPR) repeat protein
MEPDVEVERFVNAGRQALALGNPGGALEPLRRALTIDPEHGRAHALLALALLKLKRVSAALVEANAAIASEPESSFTHVVLGDVLWAQRDLRAAERHYETAREFDPHVPGPLRGLAAVARFYDDEEKALDLLRQALKLDPDDVDTLVAIAELHLHSGHYDDAERSVDDALKAAPEHRAALVVKGFVCLHKGDTARAREQVIWALRQDANDLGAIRLLAAVKSRESWLFGAWYRANAAVMSLGPRSIALLVGLFVTQGLLRLALHDLGRPLASEIVGYAWLAICYYSWSGPAMFRRLVRKEIESVRLKTDF